MIGAVRQFSLAASIALLATAAVLVSPGTAIAQGTSGGRWEVGGGGIFVGGFDLDRMSAELTPNSGTTTPFELFTADGHEKSAFGGVVRVGFYLTPSFAIEGGAAFTRPKLEVELSDDAENAADVTAEETLTQYVVDGSAVWHFVRSGSASAVPFVYGGLGYLRQLHEGNSFVEESLEYHAGGGIKWWLGERRRLGIRGDVGISIRDGGFDFDEGHRVVPVATGSVIFRFGGS